MSTPRPDLSYRRRLRHVEGWLRDECALLIAELAASQDFRGAVGEIGVHHGKLFILLAVVRKEGEAGVAVDLFEDQHLNVDGSGAGNRAAFERNLARFGAGIGVSIHSADSTTLTPDDLGSWSKSQAFRLFSVDGGHTAEITAHDLELAAATIEDRGIVMLDDYFNEAWPGVSEGANRFLSANPGLIPFGSAHGKTFFTKSATYADRYRDVMRTVAARECWRTSEQPFFGSAHVILEVQPARRRLRIRAEAKARQLLRR